MNNLEHYFENLLFEGLDYEDEINKSQLTAEQIDAVETCATYITYTFFCGRDELKKYIDGEIDVIKTGKWENVDIIHDRKDAKITDWQQAQCSVCGKWHTKPYLYGIDLDPYCPSCGAKMENDNE